MNKVQLPLLKNVLLKGLLTFFKGVKINDNDITINYNFKSIIIDENQLNSYKKAFGFNSNLPLTYLYLLAQRAQVSLMLDKHFTISIPGLIHVTNELELLNEIDIKKNIELKGSVSVKSKKEGSLKPIFEIEFYQNKVLTAKCKSIYIAKRKLNTPKKKKKKINVIENPTYQKEIQLTKKDAVQYAHLSGDKNPIHTTPLIAKLLGFKSTIIHGWYLASISFQAFELEYRKPINKFTCSFLSTINLPNKISLIRHDKKHQIISGDKLCYEAEVDTFVKPQFEHS